MSLPRTAAIQVTDSCSGVVSDYKSAQLDKLSFTC